MESVVISSHFIGKWYQIASTYSHYQRKFTETFLYLSNGCGEYVDLLYVGVKKNKDKILRNIPLKILTNGLSTLVVLKKGLFKKTLNILTFDEDNGLIILSDTKMRNFSIFSKKDNIDHCIIEKNLTNIDFSKSNNKKIKLYSRCII